MADRGKPTPADEATLRALADARARVERLEQELTEAKVHRNGLLLGAALEGISRRASARAAGVTPGRVQQILEATIEAATKEQRAPNSRLAELLREQDERLRRWQEP